MKTITVKTKGTIKHPETDEVIQKIDLETEHDVPKDVEEMIDDPNAYKHYLKSVVIEIQSEMRRKETSRVLGEMGLAVTRTSSKGKLAIQYIEDIKNGNLDKVPADVLASLKAGLTD